MTNNQSLSIFNRHSSFIKKSIRHAVQLLIAGMIILPASFSFAQTATSQFQSTASLNASCRARVNHFQFGTFVPSASGELTVIGSMAFACTNGTPYTISINAGQNGTVNARKMASLDFGNTYTLDYNLYLEDGITIMGDGTNGTSTLSFIGYGGDQSPVIFAKSLKNQYVRPGTYYDNLVLTLSY